MSGRVAKKSAKTGNLFPAVNRKKSAKQLQAEEKLQHVRLSPCSQLPPSGGYGPGLLSCGRGGRRNRNQAVHPDEREDGLHGPGVPPLRGDGGRATRPQGQLGQVH